MSIFSPNEVYINKEARPISVSGTNSSPYMQEMLANEEKRSLKHQQDVFERQTGQKK